MKAAMTHGAGVRMQMFCTFLSLYESGLLSRVWVYAAKPSQEGRFFLVGKRHG
jgi:hypothetical protein